MKLATRLAAMSLIFFLSNGAAQAWPLLNLGPAGPKTVTLDPDAPATVAEHLTPTGLNALKGVKRVAVPQFQVEYVLDSDGLGEKERGQIKVQYKIAGLDNAALQAETDKLYDRFLASLKEAGLEVVPREQLAASPSWSKLAGIGKPSGSDVKTVAGAGRMFNAGGQPWYFYAGDTHLGGAGLSWAFTPGVTVEQALSKELDAALITVRLVVGIRETKQHDALFAVARTADSFKGDPRLEAAPGTAILVAISGKTVGMSFPHSRAGYLVSDHLVFKDDILAKTLVDKTDGLGKASNLASTAMFAGAVFGNMRGAGINMKLDKGYTFQASPPSDDYVAAVDRHLSVAQDALLGQLKAAF